MSKQKLKTSNEMPIIMYQTEDGQTKVEVAFDGGTVWLSQDKMGELFQRDRTVINKHIANIIEDGELMEDDTMTKVQNLHFSRQRPTQLYNLDMILAVGYRVKSLRGIHFRKWVSSVMKEYMKKGFTMNDDLLKEAGGGTYFKELLERIRDIRSSEKVFYRQVLDIFATSIDYDPKAEVADKFFKMMQNKLLWATSGKTAPELIAARANADLPFMGLTAFKGNRPMKSEVTVAKSYLTEDELFVLRRMVNGYLEVAEVNAKEQVPMYMKDWVEQLDDFIKLNRKDILTHKGAVTREEADDYAIAQYEKYKEKTALELTQVEKDFLATVRRTYELLEGKK